MTSQGEPWWLSDLEEYLASLEKSSPKVLATLLPIDFKNNSSHKEVIKTASPAPSDKIQHTIFDPSDQAIDASEVFFSEPFEFADQKSLAFSQTEFYSTEPFDSVAQECDESNTEIEPDRFDPYETATDESSDEGSDDEYSPSICTEFCSEEEDRFVGSSKFHDIQPCLDQFYHLQIEPAVEFDSQNLGDRDEMEIDGQAFQEYECNLCRKFSPHIYQALWMCLNESCSRFFESYVSNELKVLEPQLDYFPEFLKHQPFLEKQFKVPFQLKPLTLQALQKHELDRSNEERKTGYYCSSCGRLSIRIYWGILVCSNDGCKFTLQLSLRLIYAGHELPSTYRERSDDRCKLSSFKAIERFHIPNYCVTTYEFVDGSGFVVHASPISISTKSSIEELFEDFQTLLRSQKFKRNKLRHNKISGMVAQAFTLNCGQPYKYCTEVETIPWRDAPMPMLLAFTKLRKFVDELNMTALDKIKWELLPENFNEILSCCYLPGSGMNYHSDDEVGLGPLVGSLSLGSAALMKFKKKKPKPLEPSLRRPNRPVLELLLKHGDIVLQSGSKIQREYLHSVHTDGFRISSTARFIDGNIMR